MNEYQVVAVYPSGRRYEIRQPHPTLAGAELHRAACERTAHPDDTWVYEIDRLYVGSDGQLHWRGNVDPVGAVA